ncbi:MAG: CDP-alcohol phosphatidyltransferase family protein [Mycobacteriales bacterium]
MSTWGAYADRWSALHGGADPRSSRLIGTYLRLVFRVSRQFSGISPGFISLLAVVCAAAVPTTCLPGGRWPLLAAGIAVLSGLLDSVDGTVAILSRRDSGLGGVLDSTADRLSDTAYAVALWVLGAPAWLAGLVAGIGALQEYVRARAAGEGMREIGVITIWERPTRILMTAGLCCGAGIFVAQAEAVATVGAWVSLAAAVTAFGQLTLVVRRNLDH